MPRSPRAGWILVGLLIIGVALRSLNLADKPLWLDEVLTVLFSSGQTFAEFPRDRWLSFAELPQLFTVRPLSCADLAHSIRVDSTHPPLFFCGMHRWLQWWQPDLDQLNWVARSPAVGFGVMLIAVGYAIGLQLGSPAIGLTSAALIAVSPLAVYLSQEARHYTLPMVWIGLGSWAVLQLQRQWQLPPSARSPAAIGWGLAVWSGVNLLGLYTHYFVLLAIAAQVAMLLAIALWYRLSWLHWGALLLALVGLGLGYLPWLPTLLSHTGRSETDWLSFTPTAWSDWLAPVGQQVVSWMLAVIALPVEQQPLVIQIGAGLGMLSFTLWLGWRCVRGTRHYWPHSAHRATWLTLAGMVGLIWLEFVGVVYVLGRDLTLAPRYSFVYYPLLAVLLAVGLVTPAGAVRPATLPQDSRRRFDRFKVWLPIASSGRQRGAIALTLGVGLISSFAVVTNLAFQKPFLPETVATTMTTASQAPLTLVVGYNSMQEIGVGLGVALPLWQQAARVDSASDPPGAEWRSRSQLLFLRRGHNFTDIWGRLAALPPSPQPIADLWVVGSQGMRRDDYPPTLTVAGQTICQRQGDRYGYTGYSYQGYTCD